jgi:hypothetical protein
MDHGKDERVGYHNGIWDTSSFSQSGTQKLSFIQPHLCLETEISSEVELLSFITSKLFGRQSCMSNRYKASRVFHVFGVHLQDRIIPEQSHFCFFLTAICFVPVSVFYFFREDYIGVSNVFMVVFSNEHGQQPPHHHH